MPTNVVKNERDEHLWNKAKGIARKTKSEGSDEFYAYTMGIYQQMKGKKAMQPILLKAHVKAHQRRQAGKVVNVREHEDSRQKRRAADNKYALAVAHTIQKQIGRQALYMIGAKGYGAGTHENGDAYLQFRIGRNSSSIHMIRITLNAVDTYDVEFGRITKGPTYKKVTDAKGIYNDMLTDVIEMHTGMATSLGTMGKAMMLLRKGKVVAHIRHYKSGKTGTVREHTDSRTKKQKDGLKRQWIASVLSNDESSSDAEIIDHFKYTGKMTNAEAKHYVNQRSHFLREALPKESDLKPFTGKPAQVREYKVSHGGDYYVTTHLDLKGRGIRQSGDGSDHRLGLKTYSVTEAALKKIQQQHGEFQYNNTGESLTHDEQRRKDKALITAREKADIGHAESQKAAQQLTARKAINSLKEKRNRIGDKESGKRKLLQTRIDNMESEYKKKYTGDRPGVWDYEYGHYGSIYLTTNIELKGRGIKKTDTTGDGFNIYKVSDLAFELLKKKHGTPRFTKSMESDMNGLENYPLLAKAVGTVKQHQRRTKSGKITTVREHQTQHRGQENKIPLEDRVGMRKWANEYIQQFKAGNKKGAADTLTNLHKKGEEFGLTPAQTEGYLGLKEFRAAYTSAKKSMESGTMNDLDKYPLLQKAVGTVKQHQRRTKSGTITTVREHQKTRKPGQRGFVSAHQYGGTHHFVEMAEHHKARMEHHDERLKRHKKGSSKYEHHYERSAHHESKWEGHRADAGLPTKADRKKNPERAAAKEAAMIEAARKQPAKKSIDMNQYPVLQKAVEVGKLSKSLEFTKSGKDIIFATRCKIGECQGDLLRGLAEWRAGLKPTPTDNNEMAPDMAASVETDAKPPVEPYRLRNLRQRIEKLDRIARNLDPKKKYKLSEYDLHEYGL